MARRLRGKSVVTWLKDFVVKVLEYVGGYVEWFFGEEFAHIDHFE